MWPWFVIAAMAKDPAPAAVEPEPPVSDEIIVWGDPFVRWDQRWHVETELRFGEPFRLFADNNLESRLSNVQLRVVLDCDRDVVLGPRRAKVRCVIEDIALVAMTSRPGADDLRVLQEADAAMTGAILELQVTADGGVPNVGLEGFSPKNKRDRLRQEQYRQILSRVILPFHLELPPVISGGVRWYEYNSRLMSMPSANVSAGSTKLAHFMDLFEGRLVVQTIGEGLVSPEGGWEAIGGDAATGQATMMSRPVDTYQTEMHGVALFDLETGTMSERIWAFGGELTASSPNMLRALKYGHRGHLRLLAARDSPDVGATGMARASMEAPGEEPIWRPLAVSAH